MSKALLSFFMVTICLAINVNGQQNYSAFASQNCDSTDENLGLYTCNGEKQSCKAYLIFMARPPYDTVGAISNLTFASPEELARINNNEAEYEAVVFDTNQEVIVPVNCSCAGQHYQANTTAIAGDGNNSDTYSGVANELFQGLSTCGSLKRANPYGELELRTGLAFKVPLRCACPTRNQTRNGTKFLLTYVVNEDDSIYDLGERFGVSPQSILVANGFSEDEDPTIFYSVPILIPLRTEPSSSQTVIRSDDDDAKPKSTNLPEVFLRPEKPNSKRKVLYVVFAIAAGCSVLVFVVVLVLFFSVYRKRSKPALPRRQASRKSLSPEDLRVEIASFEKGLRVFGIEEIRKATEGFCPENRVKGSVYRGVFGGIGRTLAVKRTRKDSSREVNILKKLNHFNLIKLEGLCKHHDRLYLVFEYMENGSLREWLCENGNSSDENRRSWNRRIQIALDIAQGLNYLHSFTKPGYVHKNIKSSNILLNKDMRAKIANFGLAGPATDLTSSSDKTSSSSSWGEATSHVVGTRGYVAPEYLATGISTPKIDVFAFGVVVLELLTGKNAVSFKDGRPVLLSTEIAAIMEGDRRHGDDVEDELGSFVDCGLVADHSFREFALRVAKLSVACLNREPENRPSMSEVVSTLSKILADLERFEL